MTINIEYESDEKSDFPYEKIIRDIVEASLDFENCPYEVELNVILTGDGGIREINREHRQIDSSTDVLSFPMIDYSLPSEFSSLEERAEEYFNLETGELILGDIVISVDHVIMQAEKYGHSQERELAFLVAHSMLHLFGYDHMEDSERIAMEKKQEEILVGRGYTR